jgi:hypothetical protein
MNNKQEDTRIYWLQVEKTGRSNRKNITIYIGRERKATFNPKNLRNDQRKQLYKILGDYKKVHTRLGSRKTITYHIQKSKQKARIRSILQSRLQESKTPPQEILKTNIYYILNKEYE